MNDGAGNARGPGSMQALAERLRRHLTKMVVEIGERSVLCPEAHRRAEEYVRGEFSSFGYKTESQEYEAWGRAFRNIIAAKRGDEELGTVIVGAHYDTVAGSPGADDNASAVAVMLETARALASEQLLRPVEFIGFALEEPPAWASGAQGSRVYARQARREGKRIEGMICLEMVGYRNHEPGSQRFPPGVRASRYPDRGNFIGIVANRRSKRLMNECLEAFRDAAGIPAYSLCVPAIAGRFIRGVDLSDHASFWEQGYPAVMLTDTSFFRNPYYHSPRDMLETLDIDFMAGVVRGLIASVRRVAVVQGA